MGDLEDIPSDELLDEILPQLGGYLECIDPQGQQNFDDSFNIVVGHMLLQFGLVLFYHALADQFCALHAAFVDDDLVMFAQLDLVVFDRLIHAVVLGTAFFDVVDDLQQVNRH